MLTIRRRRRATWASVAALCAVGVTACGVTRGAAPDAAGSAVNAAQITPPIALPAGVFTDSSGQPLDLRAEAAGLTTVVFFGYTHCPDVCPTTLADLGAALRSLPASISSRVQVAFITSDPVRDTPAVMRQWLAHFDSGVPRPFLGLTSSLAMIDAYAAKLGVPLEAPVAGNGTVTVTHGAEALLFGGSERADYLWLPGTTPGQYAADLRKLVPAQP